MKSRLKARVISIVVIVLAIVAVITLIFTCAEREQKQPASINHKIEKELQDING